VARVAGCSIKTVSRVINDEPFVTEEKRARVKAAIRTVGYAPNMSARRLVQNRSFMICILIYPGFYSSTSDIMTRIMDIGYEENYDILIQPYFPPHSRSKKKLVSLIDEKRIDGFVLTPPLDADEFVADLLSTYKVPQVQISPLVNNPEVPFVTGDDQQGAAAMAEYLISIGHRRISFLAGPRNMRSSHERLSGYRQALAAHDLPVDEELIGNSEGTFDGGYALTRQLLTLPDRPTAIFAGSDEAAYGAMYAAQESGYKIPQELSISGYDDLGFSKNIWPGLTTVHQPADVMLERATRMLIDQLNCRPLDPRAVYIGSQLIVRGSTDRIHAA
jgi:LacI family transcriptional regulator